MIAGAVKTLRRHPKGRHYRGECAAAWAAVILGGGWSGRFEPEAVRSSVSSGCGLGVAGQLQFAAVGSGDVDVDHLNGGEFLEQLRGVRPGRQRFQAAAEGDVQTIGEKGDEDVRLDAPGLLMVDRPDGEVAFERSKSFLDLDQLDVVAPQRGRIVSVRLLRNR